MPIDEPADQCVVFLITASERAVVWRIPNLGCAAVLLDLDGQYVGARVSAPAAIASVTSCCMVPSASATWLTQHQSASGCVGDRGQLT